MKIYKYLQKFIDEYLEKEKKTATTLEIINIYRRKK